MEKEEQHVQKLRGRRDWCIRKTTRANICLGPSLTQGLDAKLAAWGSVRGSHLNQHTRMEKWERMYVFQRLLCQLLSLNLREQQWKAMASLGILSMALD